MAGFSVPQYTFFYNGQVASSGSVYVYITGTTTPVTIYADNGLTTPLSNPLNLDQNGQASFYVAGSTNLKLVAYNGLAGSGILIETVDPVFPVGGTSAASTSIPWVVAGGSANVITATYSPAITTLTDGLLLSFRAIAANTTTNPNFSPNGLSALTITQKGGAALQAGNIAASNAEYFVRYNLANTRWELMNPSASSPSFAPVGDARNLLITRTGNATATITADEFIVETSLGGSSFKISAVNLTLNAATTGANGLDTGTLAANTFYYVYGIYNPTTLTTACVATATISGNGSVYGGANIPSGYTMSGLAGVLLTNGSSQFLQSYQLGREVFYQSPIQIFSSVTNVASLTTRSIAAAVPSIARTSTGVLSYTPANAVANDLATASDATGTGLQLGPFTGTSNVTNATTMQCPFRQLPIITAQTLFWRTGNTSAQANFLNINSFTI